MGFQLNDATT